MPDLAGGYHARVNPSSSYHMQQRLRGLLACGGQTRLSGASISAWGLAAVQCHHLEVRWGDSESPLVLMTQELYGLATRYTTMQGQARCKSWTATHAGLSASDLSQS